MEIANDWALALSRVFQPDGEYIEPLSERWRQARRGRLTASSRALIILERIPKLWNAMMADIQDELRPDYEWTELRNVPALEWGRDHEPEAIANIALDEGEEMTEPGLLFHEKYPYVAATPDGMFGKRVSVQIKCPYNSKNHLETLYKRTLRPIYAAQVQWEAWVSKAEEIRFYSYDPRQPFAAQLVRVDVPVDQKMLDKFDQNVQEFAELFCTGTRLAEGRLSAIGIPDF